MAVSWIGAHPGNYARGRRGVRPQIIVIHVMNATLESADAWFNDPAAGVSAHYAVGRAGRVHQYVQEPDTAVHAAAGASGRWSLARPGTNPNLYTIGIEHEAHPSSRPWPSAQLDASHRLVIAAARRWGIPIDGEHVVTSHLGRDFDHDAYLSGLLAAAGGRPGGVAAGLPLRLRARARLREEPTTAAPILRVLSAGATFVAAGSVIDGEPVEGNPVWHRSPTGEFLWSGATDRLRAV